MPCAFASKLFSVLTPKKKISESVQKRIVELFSKNHCDEIRKMIPQGGLSDLRPNIKAIVAYCEPEGVDSEALFNQAESIDPTGDLIMVLHAKYVWKRDPELAAPLWEKVLKFGRNPYLQDMAQEYLSGIVSEDRPLSLSPTTYYGSFMLGTSSETNPKNSDMAYNVAKQSLALNLQANINAQHWFPKGSISGNYSLTDSHYFTQNMFDLVDNEIDIPVAFHAGKNEDIVFRPLGGLSFIGGQPYESKLGIGVLGVIYSPTYKQTIQGLVYSDALYPSILAAEDGFHYRFEYIWEFFPQNWTITSQLTVEHAAGQNSKSYNGISGTYINDYTNVGIKANAQHTFKFFSVGFIPQLTVRDDSRNSTYFSPALGSIVKKIRADFDFSLQPNVTIPIIPYLNLFVWYEWRRIYSNIGPEDYVDRNFIDHTVGVAIKTYLSSY